MDKYTKFENDIKSLDYIRAPYETIYDYFPNASSYDLIEGLRIILVHNHRITLGLDEESTKLQNKMENAQIITKQEAITNQTAEPKEPVDKPHTYPQNTQALQIIESLKYFTTAKEFDSNTKNLPQDAIMLIKIYLLKEINRLKKLIRIKVTKDPLEDIDKERLQLLTYLEFLDTLKIEQEILIEEEEQKDENASQNIILLPNSKSGTYLLEDIRNYPESYDEISSAFENIMSKKFLSSKSISTIRDKGEKLYEYKRTNGIRVMFVKRGNDIYVCSLFYKDKQRSTKITQYYEEAIRRFNSFMELGYDVTSPDFIIEQKELAGLVYGEVEQSTSYTMKKGGE